MAISSPINTAAFTRPSVLKELKSINVVTLQINKEKKTRFALQKKFDTLVDKYGERYQLSERESTQEKKDTPVGKIFKKFITNQATGLGSFLFDLMKVFIGYKVLEWVANPANLQKVQGIVKGLSGIFKFINWFATGSVDNALSGLHSIFFGGSILERVFGVFRAIVGLFGIRYLLSPLKLVKDLKSIIKNGDKIGEVFGAFRKSGINSGVEKLLQTLPKTASIFKRGFSRALTRGVLRVFGKGGFKFLASLAGKSVEPLTKFVLQPIKAFAKKTVAGIPIVGPLLDFGINLALGDPIDKALIKAAGSTLGMGLGALVGSALPGPGTVVGGILGGLVGDWAASSLYDWVKGLSNKKKTPELASGGIVTRPTKAIVGEAGPEAVVPLPQLLSGDIFNDSIGMIGSGLIGGVNAFISSLGSTGVIIRPFASQLLAPYVKEFGSAKYVFNSDIGKKSNITLSATKQDNKSDDKQLKKILGDKEPKLLTSKDANPRARYNSGSSVFSLLGDIYNGIINLEFGRKGTDGSGGTSGEQGTDGNALDASSVVGSENQEKAFNYFIKNGLSKEHAAGIVGNLMIESYTDIRPTADNGSHRGIAQWDKGDRWPRLVSWAQDKNKDPNKFETQIEYLSIESGYLRKFKSMKVSSAADAAQKWEELFERSGGQSLQTRQSYANSILQKYGTKMQTGGYVFDPKKYQEGMQSSRYITVGTKENAKSYTVAYVRQGSSGTYTIKSISKKVSGSLFSGDNLTSVKLSSDEAKNVINSANVREYFRTVPNGGLAKNLKLELKPDTQADIYWAYNQSYQTAKNEWLKKGVSLEQAEQYAAAAAKEFVLTKKGASWKPGSSNGLDSFLSNTDVSSTTALTDTSTVDDTELWTKIAQSLGNLYGEFQGNKKTDGALLSSRSMELVQSMKSVPFMSDTYIITPGSTSISNVNIITPIDQPTDFISMSYSNLDSPFFPKRNL